MIEVKLPISGALVRCQHVSPLALGPIYQAIPEPNFPMVDVRSVAGGSEEHPALEGTEEFSRYQREMREYRRRIGEAVLDFRLNYGIIEWSWDEGETWVSDAPEDWTVPEAMKHWGVEEPDNAYDRRVLYIRTRVIQAEADDDAITDVVGSQPGTGQTPVLPEEIQAQLDPTV